MMVANVIGIKVFVIVFVFVYMLGGKETTAICVCRDCFGCKKAKIKKFNLYFIHFCYTNNELKKNKLLKNLN